MSHLQKFTEYTPEAAAEEAKKEKSAGFMKLKPGTNNVRILPPMGTKEPWVSIYQHFVKGLDGKPLVFNCPRRMENMPCPACEEKDLLAASPKKADQKAATELYAGGRNLCFAIDRDSPESGIQVLAFGATVKKRLRHIREKLKKNFTGLEDGFDLVIERTGQGMDTEYFVDIGVQCPVSDDMALFEQQVADLPDLETYTKVLPYDVLRERFDAARGLGEPVVETAPRTTTRKSLASAKSAALSSPEVDDDYDDDIPF